jgi:hypothetical protein
MVKQTFEKGETYQVPVDSIFHKDESSPGRSIEVPLKTTKHFEVIYDRGRHPRHFYLFSLGGGRDAQVMIETSKGETAWLHDDKGSKTIEDAAERIGKTLGGLYQIMKGKALSEVTSTEDEIRAHLEKIGYGKEPHQNIEESVQEQLESNNRRRIIYTWYQENCVGFDD